MNIDDVLASWDGRNGSNGSNGVNGVEGLEAAFEGCGYIFRHFPDCRVSYMRWQCGRNVCEIVTLPNGSGYLEDYFELVCWASTSEELIEKLCAR